MGKLPFPVLLLFFLASSSLNLSLSLLFFLPFFLVGWSYLAVCEHKDLARMPRDQGLRQDMAQRLGDLRAAHVGFHLRSVLQRSRLTLRAVFHRLREEGRKGAAETCKEKESPM